jgi:hypothetical protein
MYIIIRKGILVLVSTFICFNLLNHSVNSINQLYKNEDLLMLPVGGVRVLLLILAVSSDYSPVQY